MQKYLDDNPVGKIYQIIDELDKMHQTTECRSAWQKVLGVKGDLLIDSIEDDLYISFARMMQSLSNTVEMLNRIEGYDKELYVETFKSIRQTFKDSWEVRGNPWSAFSGRLVKDKITLKHISHQASNHFGTKGVVDSQEVIELENQICEMQLLIMASGIEAELKSALIACLKEVELSLRMYRKLGGLEVLKSSDCILKEFLLFASKNKDNKEEFDKDIEELKSIGFWDILSRLNVVVSVINSVDKLLSADSITGILERLS